MALEDGRVLYDPAQMIAEARVANPHLDAAITRTEDEKERYLNPVLQYFARLEEEIATMDVASRFRTDESPNFVNVSRDPMPHLKRLSEAEYKRAQLLANLGQLRYQSFALIGGVESLVMDMQATQTENAEPGS